jgi:hypothetical protein
MVVTWLEDDVGKICDCGGYGDKARFKSRLLYLRV